MFVCSSYQSVPYLLAAQQWPPRSRNLRLATVFWVVSSLPNAGRYPNLHPSNSKQSTRFHQQNIYKHTQNKKIYSTHPKKHMQFTSFPIVYQNINKNIVPSTSKNPTRTLKASCFSTVRSKAARAKTESNKRAKQREVGKSTSFQQPNWREICFNSQEYTVILVQTKCRDWIGTSEFSWLTKKQFLNNICMRLLLGIPPFLRTDFHEYSLRIVDHFFNKVKCHLKLL